MTAILQNVAIAIGRDRFDRNVSDEALAQAALDAAEAARPKPKPRTVTKPTGTTATDPWKTTPSDPGQPAPTEPKEE